jgi:hypothetical protein
LNYTAANAGWMKKGEQYKRPVASILNKRDEQRLWMDVLIRRPEEC